MRNFILCSVVVLLCYGSSSGQLVRQGRQDKLDQADNNQDLESSVQEVFGCKRSDQTQGHDNFDWELIRKYNQKKDNTLVSPISVKIVMAIMYAAAGGETKSQIMHVFNFPNNASEVTRKFKTVIDCLKTPTSSAYILELGSRLYLDSSIDVRQKFAAILKSAYDTEVVKLDVTKPEETVKDANKWVKQATKGNIERLLFKDDLTDVVLLLLSTIYFNGTWANQFENKATKSGKFYLNGENTVEVLFMNNMDRFDIVVSPDLDAKILRMPFVGDGLSMVLLLPNNINGLPSLLEKLTAQDISEHMMGLKNVNVRISLPKFKFNFESQLVPVLKQLGITQLFENTASLPLIARGGGIENKLAVNNVLQKAGIEVNELGTSAFAATAVTLVNKFGDGDEPPEEFIANKPFLFYIEDENTKQILFSGTVNDPTRTNGKLRLPEVKCGRNEFLANCRAPCDVTCDTLNDECPPRKGACLPSCHCANGFARNKDNICIYLAHCPSLLAVTDIPSTTAMPQSGNFLNPQRIPTNQIPKKNLRFSYFDLELLKNAAQEYKGNFMISPASIKAVLGMLLEAAQGHTAAELRSALRLSDDIEESRKVFSKFMQSLNAQTEGVQLENANSIFLNKNLAPNPNYQYSLESVYHSKIYPVDFAQNVQTANYINRWVSDTTHGKISSIVTSDDFQHDTIMLLANTLYFKGVWEMAFDEADTESSCFLVNGDRLCRNVAMMKKQVEYKYGFIETLNSQAIEMPFKDGKYSMLIFLPEDINGVAALANDLAHNNLPEILKQMAMADVNLSMPRFTMDFASDLVSILQKVGIKEVFSPAANLSNIVTYSSPQVNGVIHKTHIEVNEQGSVSAAATGAMVIPLIGTTTENMNINHPFIFLIRDTTTESILFGGRVSEPDAFTQYNQNTQNNKNSGVRPQETAEARPNSQNNYAGQNSRIPQASNTGASNINSPSHRKWPVNEQPQAGSSSLGNVPDNQEGKPSQTDEATNHPPMPYKSGFPTSG